MVSTPPASEVLRALIEQLLDGPVLRPDRIEAGRRRAADGSIGADQLAAAMVAEGRPLLQRV